MATNGPNWILDWWDEELKANFDLDVFSTPFPESGHIEIENEQAHLLLMRFDLPDLVKQRLISDFCGIPEFDLSKYRSNDSSNKIYVKEYREFQSRTFPAEYVDRMIDSRYCQHFFGKDASSLRKKWRAPSE